MNKQKLLSIYLFILTIFVFILSAFSPNVVMFAILFIAGWICIFAFIYEFKKYLKEASR